MVEIARDLEALLPVSGARSDAAGAPAAANGEHERRAGRRIGDV